MRSNVIEAIEKEKIIVIVRGVEADKLIPLAEAMYAGGIRLIEITYSQDGSVTDEKTAESIKLLAEHFAGRMYIGSGTTLTENQVELTKNAGGAFIISPDVNEAVIKKTRELGLVSIPGALTPTEVMTAHRAGADFAKLFPITTLGTDYLKAVRAPLSAIKYLAVGGIDETNIKDYLKAGASGFGIGSNIVNKELIKNGDWAAVTALAKKYTEAING